MHLDAWMPVLRGKTSGALRLCRNTNGSWPRRPDALPADAHPPARHASVQPEREVKRKTALVALSMHSTTS